MEGGSAKSHVLHRNMTFPLISTYKSELYEEQTVDLDGAPTEVDMEDFQKFLDEEGEGKYVRPVTWSQA